MAVIAVLYPPARTSQPAESNRKVTRRLMNAILVNRSNPVENLSFAELRKVFLGGKTIGRWPAYYVGDAGVRKPERQLVLTLIYRWMIKIYQCVLACIRYNLRVTFTRRPTI